MLSTTLNESDLIYCIKMVEAQAKGAAGMWAKHGTKPLPLLLCQEYRPTDLTDEQIKQAYPFPYQFVSRAEFEKAVRDAASQYAFARFSWAGYGTATFVVFTLPTLQVLCVGDSYS